MNASNLLQRCKALRVRVGRARLARRCVVVVGVLVLSFGAIAPPAAEAQTGCLPSDRPLDGSCYALLDRGKAGSTFIRRDGFETPAASAPNARTLSNVFLQQDPIPELDLFETTLIPFEDLQQGPHPQTLGGYHLNALAVAFGQAVIHDMTKARLGFSPAAITAPDFQYAAADPLCQKITETGFSTFYYFPCTATSVTNSDETVTVSLTDGTRYTYVDGTTWTYFDGPVSITVPRARFVHRQSSFPLAASLVADETGATQVPVNDVTSFLDLSLIYGNSVAVNTRLRAHDGSGRLRTAPDGEIPFGEPELANDCGAFDPTSNTPASGSGDSRVDENFYLDFVHSLLFRNHNRDAAWVAAHRPDLTTDEQRFQRARAINIARFQQQIYTEYLPAVFGDRAVKRLVGPYQGYDGSVDPRIGISFDIAFRVAHAQVSLPPFVFDQQCAPVTIAGTLGFPQHSRANCVFATFRQVGGAAIGKSAMTQSAQAITGKISDLMRNIVFQTGNGQNTAAFNLDIEQLNVIRGREFGTPNFDALRKFWRGESVYELPGCARASEAAADPLHCFRDVTPDVARAPVARGLPACRPDRCLHRLDAGRTGARRRALSAHRHSDHPRPIPAHAGRRPLVLLKQEQPASRLLVGRVAAHS